MLSKKMGIDLGTSNTRIYVPRKGIVVDEPSLVAQNKKTNKIIAVGDEAASMMGKLPKDIKAVYPLKNGVVADFALAEQMLKHFIHKATGKFHIQKPIAMMTVSVSATSTERRAVIDVGRQAGLQQVHLIHSPVAAAVGAHMPITEPKGHMIIDVGAGTTEIAVLSLGGVVAKNAVRVGSISIQESIRRLIRRNYNLSIGKQTAEDILHKLLSMVSEDDGKNLEISGRNTIKNLPKTIQLHSGDVRPHVDQVLERVILLARKVLEKTPPDLVSDIIDQGVMLAGGTAQLKGLDEFLSHKLNTPVLVAQDPTLCGAKGTHIALTHLEDYKRSLLGL